MQLSTVKRESLIPPGYLVSIALLLLVAFIVLSPSRETYSLANFAQYESADIAVDELDLAYLKAREASGKLDPQELRNVLHTMIRTKQWQQAQQLMAERPEIQLDPKDNFLLRLETASTGYRDATNTAHTASFEAELIGLLNEFLDNTSLHDNDTLLRASEISAELKQPEMSASYSLVLAINNPQNAVTHLQGCAEILAYYEMHGEAASCYRTAIQRTDNESKKFSLASSLIRLLTKSGDTFSANAELVKLVQTAPRETKELAELAVLSLESERPDLAYPIYAQLSTIDEPRAIMWLEKAATWSEASNLPGLAAEYVLNIENLSDDQYKASLAKRRQSLLLAAGRNDEALQTLHGRILNQPLNAELLLEGVDLARGMGLISQATEWNEKLLEIRPFDIEGLRRQIDFALSNKRLDEALQWARKLVESDPLDKDNRLKLAQIEEWNGNPLDAQKHRMWLAEHHPNKANDQELLRLAELNWDAATAAGTLRRISRQQPLNTENILKLVRLYQQDGRPDQAAQALTDMMTGGKRDAVLLRELAALHKHHNKLAESLQAWQTFAARFGQSNEASINQMELHWRLKQHADAASAASKINTQYLASASEYQVRLYSELGWRFRNPEFVIAAAPYIDRIINDDVDHNIYGRRLVQSYADKGDLKTAIEHSEELWRKTDEIDFLLTAMQMALDEDIYPHLERYLDATEELLQLREIPEYWLTVGNYYNRNSDTLAALETYRNTLMMLPDNPHAISGIIWTMLGDESGSHNILEALDKYEDVAVRTPELWTPYAMGYLREKDPQASLRWFSKLMVKDDHDYNVLLSFADALEQTGNSTHAFKVRSYAIGKLKPLVLAQTGDNTNQLARDYVGLLQSYGSAGENEIWTQRLIDELPGASATETAWRQEMATAWYLSTQRNDYARLLMTKSHEKRLQAPVWQQLALALVDDDLSTIREILASGKELSSGDQILALRQLGHERKAYQLAKHTMEHGSTENDRFAATDHVISLRSTRPGYFNSGVKQHKIGQLNITESGLSLRHTLAAADLGFAVDYKRNSLASDSYALRDDTEDDLAVTAYFGDSRVGGSLTAGVHLQGDEDLNYSSGKYYMRDRKGRNELNTEVFFNEVVVDSAELRLAAKQDRAELAYQRSLGKNEFIKVTGNVNTIKTRAADETISKGVGASIELGKNGSFGSNTWTMGIIATGSSNETSATIVPVNLGGIPELTALPIGSSSDAQQLAVSASLFRGGINADYPQAASPRYHLTAKLGHNWPAESVAMQLQAGAGFRLLGNDELSFQIEHEQSGDLQVPDTTNSTVGIQYRNHF